MSRVAMFGVFDSVHRGHLLLAERVLALAAEHHHQSIAITFDPHPDSVVWGRQVPLLITLEERLERLKACGFDQVELLNFDEQLQQKSGVDFGHFLKDHYLVDRVVLGPAQRFGFQGEGQEEDLRQAGISQVERCSPLLFEGRPVSSTAIREALLRHELARAKGMLGQDYYVWGQVGHGDERGRNLGFATANFPELPVMLPGRGVYVVSVYSPQHQKSYAGVANIGERPTFLSGADPLLEVHLPGQQIDLYDQRLQVTFHHFVRPEKKFPNRQALQDQIKQDIAMMTQFFKDHPLSS